MRVKSVKLAVVAGSWRPLQCPFPVGCAGTLHPADISGAVYLPIQCNSVRECMIAVLNDMEHIIGVPEGSAECVGGIIFRENHEFRGWKRDGGSYNYISGDAVSVVRVLGRTFIPVCEIGGEPDADVVTVRILVPTGKRQRGCPPEFPGDSPAEVLQKSSGITSDRT
jgi:hypothetical protein